MSVVIPEDNPRYTRSEDLHPSHWEALARRDPDEAARAAGAVREGSGWLLPMLGKTLLVDPRSRRILFTEDPARRASYQRALVAVTYLAGAVEAPPRGEWVSFRDLPGAEAFFRGPHSVATSRLEKVFGADPRTLTAAAARLGGDPCPGADACAELPALPRVSLRVLLWRGDSEFSPSAALLTDARVHLHLPLDVLWALSNVAIADLVKASR